MTSAIALTFWTIVFLAGLVAVLRGTGALTGGSRRQRDHAPREDGRRDPLSAGSATRRGGSPT